MEKGIGFPLPSTANRSHVLRSLKMATKLLVNNNWFGNLCGHFRPFKVLSRCWSLHLPRGRMRYRIWSSAGPSTCLLHSSLLYFATWKKPLLNFWSSWAWDRSSWETINSALSGELLRLATEKKKRGNLLTDAVVCLACFLWLSLSLQPPLLTQEELFAETLKGHSKLS